MRQPPASICPEKSASECDRLAAVARLCALCWVASCSTAAGEPSARGIVVPLYTPAKQHPVAVLSVDSVSEDYATHGFFRIGLMKETRVTGVLIEVRDPEGASSVIRLLHGKHPLLLPRRGIRIQGICFKGDPQGRTTLFADRLLEAGPSRWRFADGVIRTHTHQQFRFHRAALDVAGPRFGWVTANHGDTQYSVQLINMSLQRE